MSKVKVTPEVKVTVTNALENELCATHMHYRLFSRYE